jgi:transposase-like protein
LRWKRSEETVNEIAQECGVHPTQVGLWEKELQEQAAGLFEAKRGPKPVDQSASPERLYSEIGRLKILVSERNLAQKQKQEQNRGSAIPLCMTGPPLKLGLILS